jgi:probable F420-dependent oxidoreductase
MNPNVRTKFGIRIPLYGKYPTENPFELLQNLVQLADRGDVDSIWAVDHFDMPDESILAAGGTPGQNAPLEAWTTLTAVAAWTKNVELGTEVTPMIRRHPSILAKVTATIDVLAKGRLILGAGAGWYPPEFKNFGLPWYRIKERFERMYESIDVIKELWTAKQANYNGKYYHLKNARLFPKPMRKPHPPIWFGGTSDRILRSVVTYGSGWIPANNTSLEEYQTKIKRLKEIAQEHARALSEITLTGPFLTQIDSDRKKVEQSIKEYSRRAAGDQGTQGWNVAFGRSMRYGMWGTPAECITRIQQYIDTGVQHFIFDLLPPTTAMRSLELLCNEIIPTFRK